MNTAVYVQSLNQFNLPVDFTCSLSTGGACTGGLVGIGSGGNTPVNLAISVPSGTATGAYTLTVNGVVGSLMHTVQFPFSVADYSGTLSGGSLKLPRGGSGSLRATVAVTDGFAGPVSLSCSGTPEVTCNFSPTTLHPTPGTPATATVTFVAGFNAAMHPPGQRPRMEWTLALLLPAGLLVGCVVQKRRAATLAVFGIAILFATLSCGGGGNSVGGGGGGGGSNTYTVTVSASAVGTNTVRSLGTVTVTVTH